MTLRLRYAVRSHVGNVREGNEDSAFAGSRLAVVADGMGGHAAGEVASSAAISSLAHLDEDEVGVDILDALAAAVQEANDHLRDMVASEPSLDGMGTTLTVLLASGTRLGVAHVGDSRAYLLRDGELTQVTHDQTLVQRMVDEGRITAEQAERHPQRALLTQALDGREGVEPDLSLREARRGDRYLLCSDGLSGVVHEETMAETLLITDADTAAERLIELALKGGGPDNVTVVIVDVVDDVAGLSDTPMVAGAAAEKDSVPGAARLAANSTGGHLASAAEKARRLLTGRRRNAPTPAPSPSFGGPLATDSRPTDSDTEITGVHRLSDLDGGGPGAAPSGEHATDDGAGAPGRGSPAVGHAPGPMRQEAPTLVEGEIPVQTDPAALPPVADGAGRHTQARRQGRTRRRWLVPVIIVLVLLVLVVGGVWAFTRTQWYVAESEGRVALFHGVRSRPLGIPLSSVERTYFPTTCLQPVDESRVRSGYIADSRSDAVRFIDTLRRLPSSSDTGPRVPPDGRLPQPQPNPPAAVSAADCFAAGGS